MTPMPQNAQQAALQICNLPDSFTSSSELSNQPETITKLWMKAAKQARVFDKGTVE